MESPSALHLVHFVRPWTPKPSRVAFPHPLRNNTWLVKRRGDKKGQIRRRKLIWMAGGVGKLFIKMAIFLKDGCLNGSHVVRGSAQNDCILSRRKRGDFVLCQLHIEPPSYLVDNLDNMQNLDQLMLFNFKGFFLTINVSFQKIWKLVQWQIWWFPQFLNDWWHFVTYSGDALIVSLK